MLITIKNVMKVKGKVMATEKVIIKCFQTPMRKYFYDRFMNSVVAVDDQEYEILKKVETDGKLPNSDALKRFTDKGLLRNTIIEKIEHPETHNLKFLSEHYLQNLILQVTQQCNLRCKYCTYSGNYYNRTHSAKKMDFETAKKAIDFYLSRSDKAEELCLAFYGGEPLLEFPLIKKCVEYIMKNKGDQSITFPMTTNGTLLDKEKIEFLVKNNFTLMISLDGEKESHNANRNFASGKGSFDLIMKNLELLKKYDEVYYKEKVLFNCVISATTDLENVYKFYMNSELFIPGRIHFTFVNTVDIKDDSIGIINEKNIRMYKLAYIKMLLAVTEMKQWNIEDKMQRERISDIELMYEQLHRHVEEGKSTHHGGPCMPGVKRLFVEVDGRFFPCERVSEEDPQMCIGSLEKGFDYKNMDFFLNHGKMIKDECQACWNLRECSFCLSGISKKSRELTKEILLRNCEISKQNTENILQSLCILTEFGYRGNDELIVFR